MAMTSRAAAFLSLLWASAPVYSFAPSAVLSKRTAVATSSLHAMERLHDYSTNAFGSVEHVYTLRDIDRVTKMISDDEWNALGSTVAESMYESILDVGDDALKQRGWVDRMSLTNRIAEEVSSAVEKSLYRIRTQPGGTFDHDPHTLPKELLTSMHTVLRHELGRIAESSFDCNSHDLSLLVLSAVSEAVESYCGITNINAPFFDLSTEMNHRIRDRRRKLLMKHSKGYENVRDIEKDIESDRKGWVRDVLGNRAAKTYEIGEVTTKAGNKHSHQKEKAARDGVMSALFSDLDGVLMP